jgi:ribA/ribD-fused uncharacterized protein
MQDIRGFTKTQGTDWLSNFYPCKVELDGLVFHSSEAAYMAQKCASLLVKESFTTITDPAFAKEVGKSVRLRSDWDTHRVLAMTRVIYAKFHQNFDLRMKLLATEDSYLEETNSWGDRFWGADIEGNGQNMLGQILMFVRDTCKIEIS